MGSGAVLGLVILVSHGYRSTFVQMKPSIFLRLSVHLGCTKYFTLTGTVLHLTTHIHFICAGGELAMLSVWAGFHNMGFFFLLLVTSHFLSLSKVCCQGWGREIFPFTWCLVPPASNWFLQVSGEHTTSAEIPKLSWLMNSLQNLLPSFLFHLFCPCETDVL